MRSPDAACDHDCPAVDALLDILDLEVGYVAPRIAALPPEEKLALIYKTAKKGLGHADKS